LTFRRIQLTIVFATFVLMAILSMTASANPVVFPRTFIDTTFRFANPVIGFAYISLINFTINLFWFSLILLLLTGKFRERIGKFPAQKRKFLLKLMGSIALITFVGALIDIILLTEQDPLSKIYYLRWDSAYWTAAAMLIFVSIQLTSNRILKIGIQPSSIIAIIIAALNPIWWAIIGQAGEMVTFITLFLSLLLVWIPISKLMDWHSDFYAHTISPQKQ